MKRKVSLLLLITMLIGIINVFPQRVEAKTQSNAKSEDRIAAGFNHSVVVREDGTVWTWGKNDKGQLGNGTKINSPIPIQVKGLENVIAVSTEHNMTLALKEDGTVWAWGNIAYNNDSSTPIQIRELNNIVSISAGIFHSLALKDDGTVWAWGYGSNGALGNGTNKSSDIPVKVEGLKEVSKIEAGNKYSLAILENGTVWAWGLNDDYQLGNGLNNDNSNIPIQVKGLTDIVSISAGDNYALALKSDGSVFMWGKNSNSNMEEVLGTGTITIQKYIYKAPTKINGISNVSAISAKDLSIFVVIDGKYYYGQYPPVHTVTNLENIIALSKGSGHTLALTDDGSLWSWGSNSYGQLGDGTHNRSYKALKISFDPEAKDYISSITAKPTASKILVDGKSIELDVYEINGSNYFKLRDLAYIVKDSPKAFEVEWNSSLQAIMLTPGTKYTVVGGEMSKGSNEEVLAVLNTSTIIIGLPRAIDSYTIDNNNYFKLRDIAKEFNIGITWDGTTNTIGIDTSIDYKE